MRDFILENLTDTEALSVTVILMNNVIAMITAFFIMFTYKITYRGNLYSRRFNISIGSITIITAMIMSIISNNVALSLGMVGALSIIRFRTAVKDVRDATYIFWAIAAGIGCGVSQYALIAIGSAFLLLFLLLTRTGAADGKRLVVIQGERMALHKIEAAMEEYFGKGTHMTMQNVTEQNCELVYSVAEGQFDKAVRKKQMDISDRLFKIEGIRRVDIVEQKEDLAL